MNLEREARPVFDTATVGVITPVYVRREELSDQVTARMGFDPVQPRLLAALGGVAEFTDDAFDIEGINLARNTAMQCFAHSAGCHGWHPVIGHRVGASPEVGDLAHDGAIVCMYATGELLQVRDNPVFVEAQLCLDPARIVRDARRTAEHGQRQPAFGFFLVVTLVGLIRDAIGIHAGSMAGAHDSVFQRQVPDGQRFEQRVVFHRNLYLLSLRYYPASTGKKFRHLPIW